MAGYTVRSLIALLMLAVGLFANISCGGSHQRAEVATAATPRSVPLSDTFERTGDFDMFMESYRRDSDGATVRFGCSDRASAAAALALVQGERQARRVEKTKVIDSHGAKVGERIVWDGNRPYVAEVRWNEGSRVFQINAASLEDALIFEKSKVWIGAGCWDARSL